MLDTEKFSCYMCNILYNWSLVQKMTALSITCIVRLISTVDKIAQVLGMYSIHIVMQ